MPEDSNAKSSPSGLHANAAPFVPVTAAKSDKANEGKQSGAGDAATSNSSNATTAVNGAASNASSSTQSGDNGNSGSANQLAAAASSSKGGTAGGRGQKGGGSTKQQAAPSKLAAAASAAPFVPGKTGTAAAAGAATTSVGVASDDQKQQPQQQQQQQQGKQGGRKHQNQRQQQTRQQQQQQHKQQQQQKEEQQQQQQQQNESPLTQQQQQQKEQKEKKDNKEQKPNTSGKMSAAAAAFVPKSLPATPAQATPATSSTSCQQQRGPGQAGNSTPAAAARLKSPLKGSQAGSGGSVSSTSSTTPAAAHASPARTGAAPGSTSSSRGVGRGARPDSASSSRGSNLGLGSSSGPGMAGPPGSGLGMHGAGRGGLHAGGPGLSGLGLGAAAPGGPKRALLAHFQGSYQYGAAAMGVGGPFGGGYSQHHHHHHSGVPGKQLLTGQFMSEGLRQQLQQANYLTQLQYTPAADDAPLPDKLGHYHTLYPLEDLAAADAAGVSSAWGVRTTVLKGISARDGRAYALRAVCGKQVIPSMEMLSVVRSAVDMWSCLTGHPGLLVPLDGLVASELDGSPSLVVVHQYVPGAVTLQQAHLQPTQTASGQLVRNTPSEELLWSYTVQLAGILRAAHATGLALRPATLHATKVLLTPAGRLKVCGLGVAEALTGEVVPANQDDLLQLQRDDVVAMGQLLLQLACAVGSLPSPSLDFASVHYSPEFVRLLLLLLGVADGGGFSWRAVSALLGERLLLEMDSLAMFNEQLLDELQKEMENGRLFRLVSKLSFVTDRAAEGPGAHVTSAAYTESGDRYLLGLFRDFVFHQGELDGGRVLDWGHVVECLNKLDAGISEQVLLQSRDERSLLVVSYADVKRAVEATVAELRTRGNGPAAVGMMRGHGSGVGHLFGMGGR